MQTIYVPRGKAQEYGELALNIYSGCPHGCVYCYAPAVIRRAESDFHKNVTVREGIIDAVKKRLSHSDIVGKEIFLCFTCDPFPMGVDHTPTLEIIRAIKESGNHVAILTKGNFDRSLFDLLDSNDLFGVTISCGDKMAREIEPGAADIGHRLYNLDLANWHGIKTFVSFEPVYEPCFIYEMIKSSDFIDEFRIGKLNYHPSSINWKEFGQTCEALCQRFHRNYMIKDGLRKCMEE